MQFKKGLSSSILDRVATTVAMATPMSHAELCSYLKREGMEADDLKKIDGTSNRSTRAPISMHRPSAQALYRITSSVGTD